jgi:hypothetical protein
VQKDAAEALEALAGALGCAKVIIHVQVELGQRCAAEAAAPLEPGRRFGRRRRERRGRARGRHGGWSVRSGWRVGLGIEAVRWGVPVETGICQVTRGFGSSTEVGWRFNPAHWEPEGERYHRFLPGLGGENNPKLGDVGRVDVHPVISVGDVYLDEVDWAKARVGIKDALEDALQGAAELHGVARSEA